MANNMPRFGLLALALCISVAAVTGRELESVEYPEPAKAAEYYPPPAAEYYAPPPPYYEPYKPQVYDIEWGYPSDFTPPLDAYPDYSVYVGDSANFSWTGNHGVWGIPSGDCPTEYNAATPGYKEWSAPKAGGWVTVGPWDKPGTYWYSCPVTGHCAAGMKIKFVVTEYKPDKGKKYSVDWGHQSSGYWYPESWAKVGDTVEFSWDANHGVWRIPTGECPEKWDDKAEGYEVVSAPSEGGLAEYSFDKPGTYWFASPVAGDCKEWRQLYKWTVAE